MPKPIGSPGHSVPGIATPSTGPAGESKPAGAVVPAGGQESPVPNREAMTMAAQRQGKETSSLNNLRGGLQQQQLQAQLVRNPAKGGGVTKSPYQKHLEERQKRIDQASKEFEAQGKKAKDAIDQLKRVPDFLKPALTNALGRETAKLLDARHKLDALKREARKEDERIEQLMKDRDDVVKQGPLARMR